MGTIGVNWGGGGPNMAGAGASLGEALAGAIGGGNSAKAELAAAKNAAYIESLNRHNKLYDAQTALTQQKITSDANEAAIKADENMRVGQQADRAQNAANSEWMAQDARIKPAGIGVLAPTAPAIVEYDTNSKAIRDRLAYTYGNGDGAPASRADAANTVVGGAMVQQGSPEDYQRGNAMMGKPLNEKDVIPGATPGGASAPPSALPAGVYPGRESMNEGQRKAISFVDEMAEADKILNDPETLKNVTNAAQRGIGMIPGVSNLMNTDHYKSGRQAIESFLNAHLYDRSGATIGTTEFDRAYREFIPQVNDPPEVIAQKARARKARFDSLLAATTPQYRDWYFQKEAAKAQHGAGGVTGDVSVNTGAPPVDGAKQAPDGNWYVPDPSRPGKYLQVH